MQKKIQNINYNGQCNTFIKKMHAYNDNTSADICQTNVFNMSHTRYTCEIKCNKIKGFYIT